MIIEILKALLEGIVEGITEWLPISSTGHMILIDEFVKLQVSDQFLALFLVVIQIGAILAVIIMYFHKLNPFSFKKTPAQRKSTWRLREKNQVVRSSSVRRTDSSFIHAIMRTSRVFTSCTMQGMRPASL